jgi:hypothetical protein
MQLLRGLPWSVGNNARAGDGGVREDSAVFSSAPKARAGTPEDIEGAKEHQLKPLVRVLFQPRPANIALPREAKCELDSRFIAGSAG